MGGNEKGLRFFRELVARNGISARTGHTLLNNMVSPARCRSRSRYTTTCPSRRRKKGAIDWFRARARRGPLHAIGVARRAPHPKRRSSFYEYMLGGAAIPVKMDYVPRTRRRLSAQERENSANRPDPLARTNGQWTKLFEDVG